MPLIFLVVASSSKKLLIEQVAAEPSFVSRPIFSYIRQFLDIMTWILLLMLLEVVESAIILAETHS
jgi:hypothetical protein